MQPFAIDREVLPLRPPDRKNLDKLTIRLAGMKIHKVDMEQTVQTLWSFVLDGRPRQVVTLNLDFYAKALQHPRFREAVNSVDLVVPDGVPLLWLARLFRKPLKERVNGTDLMIRLSALAEQRGCGIFLLGGKSGVADRAACQLRTFFPRLKISGTLSPTPRDLEDRSAGIVSQINRSHPDFLFVALGTPRQELWIRKHISRLDVPVSLGIGGSLDFVCGDKPRAPVWMQRNGLEWLFRLLTDTSYLWRRYLIDDLQALAWIISQELRQVVEHSYIAMKHRRTGAP